jgi:hypothetical protein
MLVTEINTADIPKLISSFARVIEDRHWLRQVEQCDMEIRGNRFLSGYLRTEHNIAYQLSFVSGLIRKYGCIPLAHCNQTAIYPAVAFAAQTLSAINGFGRIEGDRFRKRVQGAFKNPNDMRALRLELVVATHFLRMGSQVSWPEVTGEGRFDLLIEDLSPGGLEVECKSISPDKGRKIHRREILEFYQLLKPNIAPLVRGLSQGLFAVLTLPGRLPKAYEDRQALVRACCEITLSQRCQIMPGGANLRIGQFATDQLGQLKPGASYIENRDVIDRITGTQNKEAMVVGTKSGGTFVFVMQSAKEDALLRTTFDVLSDAARDQLTGSRAGLLVAGFDGLGAEELRSIAAQDGDFSNPPTALRVHVSHFLASRERNHVVGTGFLSTESLQAKDRGVVSSGGLSYYFPRPESSFWCEDFREIFRPK